LEFGVGLLIGTSNRVALRAPVAMCRAEAGASLSNLCSAQRRRHLGEKRESRREVSLTRFGGCLSMLAAQGLSSLPENHLRESVPNIKDEYGLVFEFCPMNGGLSLAFRR
jgi:hypothetical protein